MRRLSEVEKYPYDYFPATPVTSPDILSGIDSSSGTEHLALPSESTLVAAHDKNRWQFANPANDGRIASRENVTGFLRHRLWPTRSNGGEKSIGDSKAWHIERLQLISLLKEDSPKVYQSGNFPNMKELSRMPRRNLSEFESLALERLYKGEETVTSISTPEIQMVGSLRAAAYCLKCHDAQRGALLGALTYSFRLEN